MSELLNLQDSFQDYLFYLKSSSIEKLVVGTEKVSIETRLAIYGDGYRLRLIDVLASHYPNLQKYLNEEVFEKLALDYIEQYPSNFRSIRWFGDKLPDFLAKLPDYKDHPYLIELAQFEWTMTLVFDSPDAPALTQAIMENVPIDSWINMSFKAHPSIYRLNLEWNAVQIWEDICENKKPHAPMRVENIYYLVIWRKNLIEQYCFLTTEEAWAIEAMLNRQSFADICEGLCQWFDPQEAPGRAASFLKGWFSAGLISELVLA